ncbi:hypothetical protein [Roseibium sp. RKSG952]|uniref:hypothetical protein n=1 Tax=Roseibium sp. RKSG952 TaxID=2529384 RepID=UPI0012BC4AE1|nr:hypothetical protein [Roseibium sp. RKSG952]MTH96552.1 hypothetical protein [Roseibium sp. RKSG952]
MTEFQNTAYVPFIYDERVLFEEIEIVVFSRIDDDGEIYVDKIELPDQRGTRHLCVSRDSQGPDAVFWNALHEAAYEAVIGEITDQIAEAA